MLTVVSRYAAAGAAQGFARCFSSTPHKCLAEEIKDSKKTVTRGDLHQMHTVGVSLVGLGQKYTDRRLQREARLVFEGMGYETCVKGLEAVPPSSYQFTLGPKDEERASLYIWDFLKNRA